MVTAATSATSTSAPNFSLETSVAIHFWYDFALATLDFMADPDHQPFVLRFGMPF